MEKNMMRRMQAVSMVAAMALFVSPMFARYQAKDLNDAVRHELVMLPYFNIFDNLAFRVDDGGVVALLGDDPRPVLTTDAESSVKKVPGVTEVVNQIKVLTLSPMDDHI